jgi:hypothetical protein
MAEHKRNPPDKIKKELEDGIPFYDQVTFTVLKTTDDVDEAHRLEKNHAQERNSCGRYQGNPAKTRKGYYMLQHINKGKK